MTIRSGHPPQDSSLLLQKVFDSLNEAVFIVETGTKIILDVNKAVEKMFGYCREEIIGTCTSVLHVNEEMSQRFASEMAAAYAKGGVYETTFQMRRKDGSVFDSEHCVTPIHDEQGQIISHVCVVRDISERVKAEKMLKNRALEQAAILDNTCVGIALIRNRTFVWANNRCREMFGYDSSELAGQSTRIIYPDDETYSRIGEFAYAAVAKGEVYDMEILFRRKDGSAFWGKSYGRAIDPEDPFGGSIWVVENITKRKEAEAALAKKSEALEDLNRHLEVRIRQAVDDLRQSEFLRDSQNRLLIDLAPEAIVVYDVVSGKIVDANANALKLFGCEREELFRTSPLSFYTFTQPDGLPPTTSFRLYTDRVLAGEVLTIERSLINRSGKMRTCEVRLVRMPSAERMLVRATYIDITDRQRMADELARALTTERNVNEEQRQFIGLISHEIRTPLSIIDGSAQLLILSACPDSECLKMAERIRSGCASLTTLIDTCLTEDRIGSSGWVPDIRIEDLIGIIKGIAEQSQSGTSKHAIVTDVERLPAQYPCDAGLIKVLLTNLVENAIKYSPNGGNIMIRGFAQDAGMITLEVADEGIGISAEQIDKIFDRFYRAWQVSDVPGAGLGLHLVRKIAKLHGGDVNCSSETGSGSTFTVNLCTKTC